MQSRAGLTHGSSAAFIVSWEFLHKVQLIWFKDKKRTSINKGPLLNSGQQDV